MLSETQPWNLFAYIPAVSLIRVRFVQFCMDAALRSFRRLLLNPIILITIAAAKRSQASVHNLPQIF